MTTRQYEGFVLWWYRYAIPLALVVFAGCILLVIDDSDLHRWKRSGMRMRTDYGTGCQYLCGWIGGCTPRLDRDGQHICDGQTRAQR